MKFECMDYLSTGITTYNIYDEMGNVVCLELSELKELHRAISHELSVNPFEEEEEEERG